MVISQSVFEKPGPTCPISLFTPHREMYTNELVINFSMADGAAARPCVATKGAPREWFSIVGTIDASRRNSRSEFPGYVATCFSAPRIETFDR